MTKIKRFATAGVAVFAVSLVVTASAFASTEAYFKVEKGGVATTLGSGETRTQSISLPAEGRLYIPSSNLTIACTGATGSSTIYNNYVGGVRKEGRLKNATITFAGCSVVGQPACYVNGAIGGAGKITTNPIAARLGYQPGTSENVEADLYPESSEKPFATMTITECVSEGRYEVKGQLVAGIGPANTFLTAPVEGVITTTGYAQEYKTIEFPGAKETLSGQELKFGSKAASIEGALEFVLPGGESVGFYTS